MHLIIISLTSLIGLFLPQKDESIWIRRERVPISALRRRSKSGLSILLILCISMVMLISLGMTIQTGIREGAQEWPQQYVLAGVERIEDKLVIRYEAEAIGIKK